jgi:predicted thioredoxin/glutaredoxin
VRLELVTRKGCHLCDEALASLQELGVVPLLRDVDEDETLFRLYDWRVPVLLVDGRVACEGRISREDLRAALPA